jgi:hypothetical protein
MENRSRSWRLDVHKDTIDVSIAERHKTDRRSTPPARQCGHRLCREIHDAQPVALGAECSEHESIAVRGQRRERIVGLPGGDFSKTGPVRIDERDLRAAFDAIFGFQE